MSESSIVFMGRLTAFLEEWFKITPDGYDSDGYLTDVAVKECLVTLLDEGLFTGRDAVRMAALREQGIIIPDEMFESACPINKYY